TAESPVAAEPAALESDAEIKLKRGQLIVIRGLDTQFYIPPTGVDIVPDTSVDDSGAAISAAAARQLLAQLPPLPTDVGPAGSGGEMAKLEQEAVAPEPQY